MLHARSDWLLITARDSMCYRPPSKLKQNCFLLLLLANFAYLSVNKVTFWGLAIHLCDIYENNHTPVFPEYLHRHFAEIHGLIGRSPLGAWNSLGEYPP